MQLSALRESPRSKKRLPSLDKTKPVVLPKSFYKSSTGVYLNPFERKLQGIPKPKFLPLRTTSFNHKFKGKNIDTHNTDKNSKQKTLLQNEKQFSETTKRVTRTRPVYAPRSPTRKIEKSLLNSNKTLLSDNNVSLEGEIDKNLTDFSCDNDNPKENVTTSPMRKSLSPKKVTSPKKMTSPKKRLRTGTSPGKTPETGKRFFKHIPPEVLADLKKSVLQSSNIFKKRKGPQKKFSVKKVLCSEALTVVKPKKAEKMNFESKPGKKEFYSKTGLANTYSKASEKGIEKATCIPFPNEYGHLPITSPGALADVNQNPENTKLVLFPIKEILKKTTTVNLTDGNYSCDEFLRLESSCEYINEELLNVNTQTPVKKKNSEETTPSPRRSPRIQREKKQDHLLPEDRIDQNVDKHNAKLFPIFSRSPLIDRVASKRSPSRSSPLSNKRAKRDTSSIGWEQLIIDAGQKDLGPQMCETCGMLFSTCSTEDTDLHTRHHAIFLGNLSFQGWKKENVVGSYSDGRVLLIRPGDNSFMIKKVEDVREIVDRDLGFSEEHLPSSKNAAYFLFISSEKKRVVGCLIADFITKAYHLLPSRSPNEGPSFCSQDSVPVVCGISRIWTAPKWRRKKVASRLVDCLRCHFMYGQVLSLSDLAFSAPTVSGQVFAEKYTGRKSFLVYG